MRARGSSKRRRKRKQLRWISKLARGESGAVSVMMMITLSALLLSQTVLLELGKVWTAEREAESALKAAVRSALSAYDHNLQQYGLYGVDEKQAESVFDEVLEANMSVLQPASFWSASPIEVQETSIQFDHSLANKEVFEAQVLEEMKYRAPVEYVLRIMEPFQDKGVANQLSNGSQLRSSLKQLESLIRQREEALDDTSDQLGRMLSPQGRTSTVFLQLTTNLTELYELAEQIGLLDIDVIRQELKALQQEQSELEESRKGLQNQMQQLAMSMQGGPNPGAAQAISQLGERIATLNEAIRNLSVRMQELSEQLDRLIRYWALIGEVEFQLNEHYDWLTSRLESIERHLDQARERNEQLRSKVEEAGEAAERSVSVYPGSLFTDTAIGAAETVGQFGALRSSFLTMELATGKDFVKIHDRLVQLSEAWRDKSSSEWNAWNSFDQQRKRQQAKVANQKQAEKERTEKALSQLKELFYDCPGMNQTVYAQLGQYNQLYNGFGEEQEQEDEQLDSMEAETAGNQAFSLADQLSGVMLGARDKAYVSEFVMNKFTYRTYDGLSHEKAHAGAHMLANQEAEYVIYGLGSCAANHSAAFTEMFMTRLAIRTVEALFEPDRQVLTFLSPWLTFLWALAEGAAEALNDMRKLVQGERVELSARLTEALAFDYKDYLRMFLLLHPQSEKCIARMQTLVHANTGQNLHDAYTYAHAKLRGKAVDRLPGQIIIGKEAAWSY